MTWEPRLNDLGSWRCARVPMSIENDYFDLPSAEPVPWGDKKAIERLISHARIYVFDEDDLAAVKTALSETGVDELPDYRFVVVKPVILMLDEEEDGTLYTIGHTGATNCDLPKSEILDDIEALSDVAFNWICEIVTVVNSYETECYRLSFEYPSQDIRPATVERDRLVVTI
jgi:hypothetical protein